MIYVMNRNVGFIELSHISDNSKLKFATFILIYLLIGATHTHSCVAVCS